MRIRPWVLASVVSAAFPATAMAEEQDFFVGVDVFGDAAFGTSSTKDGGGNPPLFNGDGVVNNVRFGETIGIGGHIGYRFDPSWSAFISYQHIRGDVRWDATYPSWGVSSRFDGDATSDAIMGNVAYERPLSDATAVSVKSGLGVTFNRLSGLVETDKATGQFVANVAARTKISPIAQIGAGFRHNITSSTILGLDASIAYAGGFETGNTRSGNLGVTSINPYKIDNVWRANLGASVKFQF
jgi:Outer membrane protein beta-barrel domain